MSGIGGIGNWRDAAEFILLGCGTVQVCTAVMHFGYRIVEDMIDGLSNWMDSKGFVTIEDFRGRSLPKVTDWQHLNLNYKIVAHIDESQCIGCQLCHIACWDGAHQCIHLDRVTGAVDGHVEVHAKPHEYGRETIAVTPIPRLDPPRSAPRPLPNPIRPHPARGRDRVRRLQSLLAGLPRRRMHHHGRARYRIAGRDLGGTDRCAVESCRAHSVRSKSDGNINQERHRSEFIRLHARRCPHRGRDHRASRPEHRPHRPHRRRRIRHARPPGGIDVHTHLDMPFGGTVSADDYEWGTRAAAIGGTTTVIDFALQSMGKPMTEAFKTWRAKSEGKACIDYALHMAVTDLGPNDAWLDEVDAMVAEGITSFKIFMAYPNVLMVNDATIFKLMQRTAKLGALVCVHAENGTVIDVIVQQALAAGHTGPLYHALTRPSS